MAEKEPLFKLPVDIIKRLREQGEPIKKARDIIRVMKELGMDTTELEDKLNWSEKVKDTLLKEFA